MQKKKKKRSAIRWIHATAGEIRAVCDAHPDHPGSLPLRATTDRRDDDYDIIIAELRYEAVKQNRELHKVVTPDKEPGWETHSLSLGEEYGAVASPEVAPETEPEEDNPVPPSGGGCCN